MPERRVGPWWLLRAVQLGVLAVLVLAAGAIPSRRDQLSDAAVTDFVRETAQRWCNAHGRRADLHVVGVDVRFYPEPPLFAEQEGMVVAPVGVTLPGVQRVVAVASRPTHLRQLTPQGVTTLAWEYAGRANREMRHLGLALVERPVRRAVSPPTEQTFGSLPVDIRPDALARAVDLEEHDLQKCAAFGDWVHRTAGAPPQTQQIERLVQAAGKRQPDKECGCEDICAAFRKGRFTAHEAHVLVVMGARELGVPIFAFSSASATALRLVGTFTDQTGWIFLDVDRPAEGWWQGGTPLLTLAPVLGGFQASRHDFWRPEGGAYAQTEWGFSGFSSTEWRGQVKPGKRVDTTEAWTRPLAEVCQ